MASEALSRERYHAAMHVLAFGANSEQELEQAAEHLEALRAFYEQNQARDGAMAGLKEAALAVVQLWEKQGLRPEQFESPPSTVAHALLESPLERKAKAAIARLMRTVLKVKEVDGG